MSIDFRYLIKVESLKKKNPGKVFEVKSQDYSEEETDLTGQQSFRAGDNCGHLGRWKTSFRCT